jgi:predicted nucleic acid-binding protein
VGPVALDASVVIGLLESTDAHHERAIEALQECEGAPFSMAASAYSEVLVRPLLMGSEGAVEAFVEDLLVEIVPLDRAIARRAAELRAEHERLRLPDAVVLASAESREARLLTFDERLAQL